MMKLYMAHMIRSLQSPHGHMVKTGKLLTISKSKKTAMMHGHLLFMDTERKVQWLKQEGREKSTSATQR